MKYYTLEEIIEALKKLWAHGWGRMVVDFENHKIPHYEARYSHKKGESHKPEEGEKDG